MVWESVLLHQLGNRRTQWTWVSSQVALWYLHDVKNGALLIFADSPAFDAKAYYEQLITTSSLATLLKRESELLSGN